MIRLYRELKELGIAKKLEEKVSKKIVLKRYHDLRGVADGFCIDNLPEEVAEKLEEMLGEDVDVFSHPSINHDGDMIYYFSILWEGLNLARKKEIVLALYMATEPIWSQYEIYSLRF